MRRKCLSIKVKSHFKTFYNAIFSDLAGSDCSDVPCTPGDDDCVGYLCQCPPGYDTTVVTTEVSLGVVDGVAITANKHSFVCTDIDECAIQVHTQDSHDKT